MKRLLWSGTVFVGGAVLAMACCGLYANTEQRAAGTVMLYDYKALQQPPDERDAVAIAGAYSVWVWAPEKGFTGIEISGEMLKPAKRKKPRQGFYWQKIGSVKLEKGEKPRVKIVGDDPTSDPKFDPERSFELASAFADNPREVRDRRLHEVWHTDSFFKMPTYASKTDWGLRAESLRRRILVSSGLWPMPNKCPLNAKIFGRIERDGYTVEKVYFESWPGFYVTGNLYRPAGREGQFPGIACPHGHWGKGRLENTETGSVPGRCINFARQGYVAFSYDMVGYNDSKQVDHRFGGKKELYWAVHPLGLQLWSSIRVLDFLESLPDVDANRLGCTGASGGGTQTFLLMAVDDRVKVAAPVNMISSHFQGGCLCENAPALRLGTFNVETAATMAPRPLLMVAATGDWTDESPRVEYPAVRSVYRLFDAEQKVHCVQIDSGHNYNKDSREAVYAWFGRWLLGETDAEKLKEQPFTVEKDADLLVFEDGKLPNGTADGDEVIDGIIAHGRALLEERRPKDAESLARFRNEMGPALADLLGSEWPDANDVVVERTGRTKREDFWVERLIIGRASHGDEVPAILYVPTNAGPQFPATLVAHPDGKSAFVDIEHGEPGHLVSRLLARGHAVLAIDTFLTGDYHSPFKKAQRKRLGIYFTTFNPTDDALRVQDILTALAYLEGRHDVSKVNLVGLGDAGLWSLLARGLARNVERTVIDLDRFDPESITQWGKRLDVPGILRAGGIDTAATLTAPGALLIHNTGPEFNAGRIAEAYRSAGADKSLSIQEGKAGEDAVAEWVGG